MPPTRKDNVAWKEEFLAEHPEWSIFYSLTDKCHKAVRESTGTRLMHWDLGQLMADVEAATEATEGKQQEAAEQAVSEAHGSNRY
jgi:hypothetical protein